MNAFSFSNGQFYEFSLFSSKTEKKCLYFSSSLRHVMQYMIFFTCQSGQTEETTNIEELVDDFCSFYVAGELYQPKPRNIVATM